MTAAARSDSGVFDVETTEDDNLRQDDGSFVGTLCRTCHRYKRDALSGPNRMFFRCIPAYCSCDDNRATQRIALASIVAMAFTALACATGEGPAACPPGMGANCDYFDVYAKHFDAGTSSEGHVNVYCPEHAALLVDRSGEVIRAQCSRRAGGQP